MNIAIIYGGRSGEHEVSLVSAAAVTRGVSKKHNITLIAITKSGKWYFQPESELNRILNDEKQSFKIIESEENALTVIPAGKKNCFATKNKTLQIDAVFPVLHGTYGEDGTIQGLFEMAEIPYVGCNTLSSSLTMDKEKTKQILECSGIKTVPYICMKRCDMLDSNRYDELFQKAIDTLGFPLFIKPCCAGSSNGASKATTKKEFSYALMEAFSWDDKVLIEKAIDAREIECSVTGNSVTASAETEAELVKAYIPGEILPTHAFYDYDAKYNDPNGAMLKIPAELSKDITETLRSTAVKAYKALDCTGLSRVDFLLSKTDGTLYLNEVNSLPGFTPISMFPKMCQQAGLDFESLTELLIQEAISRFNSKTALQTDR